MKLSRLFETLHHSTISELLKDRLVVQTPRYRNLVIISDAPRMAYPDYAKLLKLSFGHNQMAYTLLRMTSRRGYIDNDKIIKIHSDQYQVMTWKQYVHWVEQLAQELNFKTDDFE